MFVLFTLVQIWLTQFPLEAADSILIVTGKCLIIILSLCCNMEKRIHITPLPHRLILFYFFGGGEYMNFELLGSGPYRNASWKVREIQLMDLGQITFCRIKVFWMHVRAPFNNVTIVSLVDFLSWCRLNSHFQEHELYTWIITFFWRLISGRGKGIIENNCSYITIKCSFIWIRDLFFLKRSN